MSRIFFVNRFFHPDHSATSRLVSDLAFELASSGFEVTAVTSRQRYDDPGAVLASREMQQGVKVVRVPSSRFGRKWLPGRGIDYASFLAAAGWRLFRAVRAGDIVVFKTDPPMLGSILGWIARRRGARVVNWLQDLFPDVALEAGLLRGQIGRRLGRLLAAFTDHQLRRADACVAVGQSMATRLADHGIESTVIDNWCDTAGLKPDAETVTQLREQWQLEDRFVVAYSGNLGRAHPIEMLRESLAALDADSDVVVLITGGGAGYDQLQSWCAEKQLERVVFKPYQPESLLPALLALADVHLVILAPSFEGLIVPSKFSSIAGAGRPTIFIGSPQGQVARWIAAARCGATVQSSSHLTETVQHLKAHPQERIAMGQRAFALARDTFDRPVAMARWRELLTTLGAAPGEGA